MVEINGWKLTAIIFIILFILETIFLIFIFNMGMTEVDNEIKCSNEICPSESDSFTYSDGLCQCYKNNEIIKEENLNG